MQSQARRNAVGETPSSCSLSSEKRLRLVVLGASGVGKTQLVSRFLGRPFNSSYLPTAEDFHRTKYIIGGRTFQLDILDTAGHIISPVMQKLTLLTGDLFVVVYSITDRGSWERAKDFISSIEEVTSDPARTNKCMERTFKHLLYRNGATTYQSEKFANGIDHKLRVNTQGRIPILLAGNKFDLDSDRMVSDGDVSEYVKQKSNNQTSVVTHIEVSSKTDHNVQELFKRLFTISSLPLELSPNMHRKVSEGAYVCTRLSQERMARPKSAEGYTESTLHRKISSKNKSLKLRRNPSCRSSGSSLASSSDSLEDIIHSPAFDTSSGAMATVITNQRRPSVDTEVLLAFAKVRTSSLESQKRGNKIVNSCKKLKDHVFKLTINTPDGANN